MENKFYTLYLVGQIADNSITHQWRKDVRDFFKQNKNVLVIDPTLSEYNIDKLEKKFDYSNNKISALLPYKDRNYVKKSNVIFANMNWYDQKKLIIGSFFELAWAFDKPDTIVIGIYDGDPTTVQQCNHPFVKETIQIWTKTVEESCLLLNSIIDIEKN